jgi:DNA-binding beta-propeller fold protein YncE
VSVINRRTHAVTATITVGSIPVGIAVNPVTGAVYVANNGSGNVSVISR